MQGVDYLDRTGRFDGVPVPITPTAHLANCAAETFC